MFSAHSWVVQTLVLGLVQASLRGFGGGGVFTMEHCHCPKMESVNLKTFPSLCVVLQVYLQIC